MNSPYSSPSVVPFASVDDTVIDEALGFREDRIPPAPAQAFALESTPLPTDWRATISPAGYEFIVRWETGGKAYYEQVIKGRPVWPRYSSGITIGCGFDLGYHTFDDYTAQWKARLGGTDFQRLAGTIGFRTVAPNREQKVVKAKALVQSLADIVVPWATAIEQFDNAKLPELIRQLYAALDNLDRVHAHCRAALLSLVFNRGPSFTANGDRYTEMRAIHAAMQSGSAESFAKVPALLRSMKRIWGLESSLAERREGEAKLFEAGLREMALMESFAQPPAALEDEALPEAYATERHDDVDVEPSDEADEAEAGALEALTGIELDAATLSAASVRWNPRDDEQPDYRHLDLSLVGSSFELAPADLDLLIAVNEFAVKPNKIIFALRGAVLQGGEPRRNVTSVALKDQRPDHREYRCVIGVYDKAASRLWAFPASTVPNAAYVFKCYSMAQAGTAIGGLTGNILPTGCYTFTVGTHKKNKPGEIPGVLRLSTTASGASEVVVLRSLSDVIYDRFDRFPVAAPADNIHPGILANGFSSAGCLTIPGRFAGGAHTGLWAEFRQAAGLAGDGVQYSGIVLTGLDAALASRVRTANEDQRTLLRLRHGSKGARVAALQAALGLAPDASQLMGPVTRAKLIARQTAALGWADGIYSPAMDDLLGFNVYP